MSPKTEKIQEAKQAISEFLKLIGIKVDKDLVKNLPQPRIEENEVLGKIFKFEIDDANFEVTEEPLRISSYSNKSFSRILAKTLVGGLYSCEEASDRPEKEAEQKALQIACKLVPRFKERNFVLDKFHSLADLNFHFQWNEFPKGKIISVVNNFISIELNKKTLEIFSFSMFDFDHPRTDPPKIPKEEAVKIARKEWGNKGEVRYAELLNQVIRGKDIRTIWTIKLKFKIDEGRSSVYAIIDADTGKILEGKKY